MRQKIGVLVLLFGMLTLPVWAQDDAEPIEYGDEVVAEQQSNNGDYYRFSGSQGDVVVITMESDDFDTYLELLNEDEDQIAFNDDFDGLNSQITFALPEDGAYLILARSFGSNARGDEYRLTLELTELENLIVYGDEVEGRVSDDEGERWYFFGEAGDVVTITMNSDIIDTYLELFIDDYLLSANDDSGGTLDSQITNFELPDSGLYTIVARSFAGGSSGAYTLLLEGTGGDGEAELSGNPEGVIEYGQQVSGMIETADGDLWTFEGEEGQYVLIAMNSPSTDCYLDLFAPDGEYLIRDDDGGIGFNAAILIELPEDGEYTVVTRGFAGATGSYVMSVEPVEDLEELIYAEVTSSNRVNLRDESGENATVVDSTYPNDFFLLVGRSEDDNWFQIASVVGSPRWISGRVIDEFNLGGRSYFEDLPVTD